MFNKIWYRDEELVAVSDHILLIYLLPFLILGFFVSFKILISLVVFVLIAAKVVRVRGAMTLELDPIILPDGLSLCYNFILLSQAGCLCSGYDASVRLAIGH